jgi:hypothetical protein
MNYKISPFKPMTRQIQKSNNQNSMWLPMLEIFASQPWHLKKLSR